MPILDNIKDAVTSAIPQKRESLPQPGSTGVGYGVRGGDSMILSKTFIAATAFQIFLSFIAMCCFAGVASFQAKFKVGPSALSVLAIFSSLILFFLASFLLAVPVIYDRYDRLRGLARSLRIIRVAFICNGIGIFFSLISAFVTTISVATQAGCKNPSTDPSAHDAGKKFVAGLPDWCRTKRAGSVFFWLTLIAWGVTSFLTFQEWRTGKTIYRPEDPPFSLPSQPVTHDDEDEDPYTRRQREATEEDDEYDQTQSPFNDRYGGAGHAGGGYGNVPAGAGRQSMDAYGAFSGPEPTGYGRPAYAPPAPGIPEVSRTMQYADPYAAVRASIHGGGGQSTPPSYEAYQR